MPLTGEYEPSQNDRTVKQVELYEATNGVKGGTLNGKPVIVLTYSGAKSGGEKDQWWKRADAAYPDFPAYRARAARAGREIPVVLLEPLPA